MQSLGRNSVHSQTKWKKAPLCHSQIFLRVSIYWTSSWVIMQIIEKQIEHRRKCVESAKVCSVSVDPCAGRKCKLRIHKCFVERPTATTKTSYFLLSFCKQWFMIVFLTVSSKIVHALFPKKPSIWICCDHLKLNLSDLIYFEPIDYVISSKDTKMSYLRQTNFFKI